LLGYDSLSEQRLTKMWHGVIKYIRGLIDYLVKERIEGINASEKISEQNYKNMLRNLEKAKKKEMNNQIFFNKFMKELEEAKASFQQNSLQQLNTGNSNLDQSFLFSSQRNGKKPTIPSYLLMSTINNGQNRGRGGPAEENLNRGNSAEANPEEEQPQIYRSNTNSPPQRSFLNNPLLTVQYTGQRPQINTNSPPQRSFLNNPLLTVQYTGQRKPPS